MRVAISTVVDEGITADVRLVHIDDRATPVEYPVWRRIEVSPDRVARLEIPENVILTATATGGDAIAAPPVELRTGGVYRIDDSDGPLTLSLHAIHQLMLRRQAGVLNESERDARLELAIGDAVAWRATVGALSYGIFDLTFAVELTFRDAAGHEISRSLYVPREDARDVALCCRRIPSTRRLYIDAAPPSALPVASRRDSPTRVTFRVRGQGARNGKRLAVFLVPRNGDGLRLVPWQIFDLRTPQRFSFESDARAVSTVLPDGQSVAPRGFLPGQVQALVESAAGEVSLVIDDDAWVAPQAARIDNYTHQAIEARLSNGGRCYAAAEVRAAAGGMPSHTVFESGPPSVAFLLAPESRLYDPFDVETLAGAAHFVPMPRAGSNVSVVADGTHLYFTPNPPEKEQ